MKFTHPLARRAKLWQSETLDGGSGVVFVIETTLELHPGHKRFKKELVDRLRVAAKEHVRQFLPTVREIVLMNPPEGRRAARGIGDFRGYGALRADLHAD